jgi:hypothetical protein
VVKALLSAILVLGAAHAPQPRLPDLDQAYPRDLVVNTDTSTGTARFHIGFLSAVSNYGSGPLIVQGHRASVSTPFMTADQILRNADGSTSVRRDVGRLAYVNAITHQHWHYLGFDRYELRSAKRFRLVVRDRKSGFCLGDRYTWEAKPPRQVFNTNCDPDQPGALGIVEGISPGYGDDYSPIKEGQFLDVTGVPAGRYWLVHRTNVNRALLESDYSNDAASVLISLRWPAGTGSPPRVAVLRHCVDTARC